jgi:hypothetical protein
MAFAEDLPALFADFASPATLQAVAVASGVIFDADYVEPLGSYVEATGPAATAIASEVSAAAHGQTLVISAVPGLGVPGGTYTVRGVKPFDSGLVVLKLQEP